MINFTLTKTFYKLIDVYYAPYPIRSMTLKMGRAKYLDFYISAYF